MAFIESHDFYFCDVLGRHCERRGERRGGGGGWVPTMSNRSKSHIISFTNKKNRYFLFLAKCTSAYSN